MSENNIATDTGLGPVATRLGQLLGRAVAMGSMFFLGRMGVEAAPEGAEQLAHNAELVGVAVAGLLGVLWDQWVHRKGAGGVLKPAAGVAKAAPVLVLGVVAAVVAAATMPGCVSTQGVASTSSVPGKASTRSTVKSTALLTPDEYAIANDSGTSYADATQDRVIALNQEPQDVFTVNAQNVMAALTKDLDAAGIRIELGNADGWTAVFAADTLSVKGSPVLSARGALLEFAANMLAQMEQTERETMLAEIASINDSFAEALRAAVSVAAPVTTVIPAGADALP